MLATVVHNRFLVITEKASTDSNRNRMRFTDLSLQAQDSATLAEKKRSQLHLGCTQENHKRLFLKRTNQNAKAFSSQKKDNSDEF